MKLNNNKSYYSTIYTYTVILSFTLLVNESKIVHKPVSYKGVAHVLSFHVI